MFVSTFLTTFSYSLNPPYTVSSTHSDIICSVWSPLQEAGHKERRHRTCHEWIALPGLHGCPHYTLAVAASHCVSFHWSRGFWVAHARQPGVDDSKRILGYHFQCRSTGVYCTVFSAVRKVRRLHWVCGWWVKSGCGWWVWLLVQLCVAGSFTSIRESMSRSYECIHIPYYICKLACNIVSYYTSGHGIVIE